MPIGTLLWLDSPVCTGRSWGVSRNWHQNSRRRPRYGRVAILPECEKNGRRGEDPEPQPTLRLVSGLADGVDHLAFRALLAPPGGLRRRGDPVGHATRRELVAVLPCDATEFRDNSAVHDKAEFDALFARCDCVIQLDGRCDPADHCDPL